MVLRRAQVVSLLTLFMDRIRQLVDWSGTLSAARVPQGTAGHPQQENGKHIVSVLGRDKGYTVKYNPLPEGVPEGKARGNS